MSEIESKLKEEGGIIKEVLNFNGDESQLKHIKEIFTNYVKNSKNDLHYFPRFIDYYSLCRPNQQDFSRELVGCLYSCFPERIDEIQRFIRGDTLILKFIVFPEEFPINKNKEQNEMFMLLQKDDVEGFISFLAKNPKIKIIEPQEVERAGYYFWLFNSTSVSLINFCCLFGSLKCFKYLLLNKCETTDETLEDAIAGGNLEIVNILKEKGYPLERCLFTSVPYHRYELTNWLNENYKCEPILLPTCIQYYNIDAFFFFLEHGNSLDEIDEEKRTCLHSASCIGPIPCSISHWKKN